MAFRKRWVVTAKGLVLLVTLITAAILLPPQSMLRGSEFTTRASHLRSDANLELQPTEQRDKVDSPVQRSTQVTTTTSHAHHDIQRAQQRHNDSVFTLVPEMPRNTTVLIIINTVPSEFNKRNTLRQTWAKQSSWTFGAVSSDYISISNDFINIAYFFLMGFNGRHNVDEMVKGESTVHRDILRVNLKETYRGLVDKLLITFEWVTRLEMKPHFIVKADHDVYVKIPELASWLEKFSRTPARVYAGFVKRKAQVKRDVRSPWYVSEKDFHHQVFPPYCRGPFYLFSRNLFLDVVNASKVNTPFPVEDAYMGHLVQKIGVEPLITGRDVFNDRRSLEKVVLRTPENKLKIPSGIVLGDSLSSAAINRIHRVYTGLSKPG